MHKESSRQKPVLPDSQYSKGQYDWTGWKMGQLRKYKGISGKVASNIGLGVTL